MKNDKQDRKLLAQLAAGYMAYYANSKIDLTKLDRKVERSVEYAIGALAAIDAHLETRRAAEVQERELLAELDRELPSWAVWVNDRLIAKHFCGIDELSKEIVMARADGSGWMAWIRRGDQAQRWGSVSGPETGAAARAKIYEALDWESYAPGKPAEIKVSTEPSAAELLACAHEIETGRAAAQAETQAIPTPQANPDMVRAALVSSLQYLDPESIAFRRTDGSPVSARGMLDMIDANAPEVREYLHDVYCAAVRAVRVKAKRVGAPGADKFELPETD